ncbi:MAG: DUF6807 family protein [Pirellulales bacterium]
MRTILSVCFCFAVISASPAAESEAFRDETGKHLDFLQNDKPIVRYMYAFDDSTDQARHETYKVYHHVFDPAGGAFITKGSGGKYTHHRGIFIGFARLGHGGKTYDHWHMANVNIRHKQFIEKEANDKSAAVTSLIHWNATDGKPIIEEQRTLRVHFFDKNAHLLTDFVSRLKAVNGEVVLKGDPEHAGMQYRPANEVAQNKSAKYTFHADGINPKKDRDLPWVALTYKLGQQLYTVQHMRHPDDPSDSVYSAYRDYGRFGNYFVHTIADGDSLTVRYRLRITLGAAPSREVLAAEYEKYVSK